MFHLPMPYLEPTAALLCAAGATALAFQRRRGWIILNVACLLYGFIFLEQRFYANVALQGVFILLGLYGIRNAYLVKGTTDIRQETESEKHDLDPRAVICALILTLIGTVVCAMILRQWSNDPAPHIDGVLTAFSILANYWMARRQAICWLVWLGTDTAYAVLFFHWGANLTGVLYIYLSLLSIHGYRQWKKKPQGLNLKR